MLQISGNTPGRQTGQEEKGIKDELLDYKIRKHQKSSAVYIITLDSNKNA